MIENTSRDVLAAASEAEIMQLLRRAKSEAALLIALCDIGGVWPVMQVTAALTDLAVNSVQAALRFLLRQEVARGRMTAVDQDRPEDGCGLIVLAMGKFGAGELNYSSDIDLIVFFDPDDSLVADIEPATFCVRVTQALVALLQERPAMAMSFARICGCAPIPARRRSRSRTAAALHYYESMGRTGNAPR